MVRERFLLTLAVTPVFPLLSRRWQAVFAANRQDIVLSSGVTKTTFMPPFRWSLHVHTPNPRSKNPHTEESWVKNFGDFLLSEGKSSLKNGAL